MTDTPQLAMEKHTLLQSLLYHLVPGVAALAPVPAVGADDLHRFGADHHPAQPDQRGHGSLV